eukprot:6211741-Pleurochrysis_carterae.AAC.9
MSAASLSAAPPLSPPHHAPRASPLPPHAAWPPAEQGCSPQAHARTPLSAMRQLKARRSSQRPDELEHSKDSSTASIHWSSCSSCARDPAKRAARKKLSESVAFVPDPARQAGAAC